MEFESKRIFELHIFKDSDKTNWTGPSVHVFPLSSRAFPRFNRVDPPMADPADRYHGRYSPAPAPQYFPRDGLLNLWKCGPEQLAFLQRHIERQNDELRKGLENTSKEYKKLKAEDEKHNNEEKKRYREEMEKFNKKAKEGREEGEERGGRQRSVSPNNGPPLPPSGAVTCFEPLPPPHPQPRHGPYWDSRAVPPPPRAHCATRGRSYQPEPRQVFPGAIEPPQLRKPRVDRAVYESYWTLESVELDLQPFEAVFESDTESGYWQPVEIGEKSQKEKKGWQKGNLKITRYQLSEQGKHEFAVVLSRNISVKRKYPERDVNGYLRRRSVSPPYYMDFRHNIPQDSFYGEVYDDQEEEGMEHGQEGEQTEGEKGTPAQDGTPVEEEDQDLEVVPSPNETSTLEQEDGTHGH